MHKYFLKSSKLWLELPLHNPGHLNIHNDLFKKCEADAEVADHPKMHKVCFQKLKLKLELHTSKANPNPTQANPSQSKSITKLTKPKPNGAMEQWSNGAIEQWSNVAMEQWSNGAIEQLSN